jgi:hypothetical protein
VAGRDLHRTGAELAADGCVGDHRNLAAEQRHQGSAAHQMTVALVVRVHRHAVSPRIVSGRVVATGM